ncbi:hypothetical protein AC579_10229 [Pseudocercospora musae]|uniref:Uncharacterized protein n=1 Tax=Pseudocercospora musae TaxID=113226 RepID=A0A139GW28_9PEZI|nr:hypothetical protein AC579_10229 [Pseudocercospora musae]
MAFKPLPRVKTRRRGRRCAVCNVQCAVASDLPFAHALMHSGFVPSSKPRNRRAARFVGLFLIRSLLESVSLLSRPHLFLPPSTTTDHGEICAQVPSGEPVAWTQNPTIFDSHVATRKAPLPLWARLCCSDHDHAVQMQGWHGMAEYYLPWSIASSGSQDGLLGKRLSLQ